MRLAVVSPFVDRTHGTERAVAELLERLARCYRCEIHLYSQHVEGLAVEEPNSSRTGSPGAIYWHRVPSTPGPHILQFLGWLALNSFQRWLHRRSGSVSPDLVVSPGINGLRADVVIVHALFQRLLRLSDKNAITGGRAGFFRLIHRRAYYRLLAALERRIYRNQNVLLACVSQRTADLLARYFHRHDVHVVPNGIDSLQFSAAQRVARRAPARLRRRFQDADLVLLLLGNDWTVKGAPTILAAIAAVPALPLHLLVAGLDDVEPFRKMAAFLNISSRFHCEPPCSDVMDFYASADIYASPTQEDSFGLPVLEAMACALPVITSVFAGVAELISDEVDGFVLRDPNDAPALAQLLQRLYVDVPLRKRTAEAATLTAQRWTWDRNAEEIWKLLNEAAEKKAAAVKRV